ncbi:T9SS type A sorting domain-containing protein [Dyadobacter sp. CY326]|uniref:T9SS type A sorting domain-containing protein n=1 Tax=Dyadobacter sp. CY326 TaxID=2907300 RepID=UPI001F45E6B2|nr:T9SS type A sorting domain-containing protein [Dyadobacter sp. CY326]MCE7067142.1 T9SS type A sorting domain-containing protein [Dyadobacter sp. CY326]
MKKIITTRPFHYFIHTLTIVLLILEIFTADAQSVWTGLTLTPEQQLHDVAYGAGKYVAVGANNIIRTSTNGATWETQQSGLSNNGTLYGIVFAHNLFVAVGSQGMILTSPDGISWSTKSLGTGQILRSVTFGYESFVIVGSAGALLTSPDGQNWTPRPSGVDNLNDVAYVNYTFIAVGSQGVIKTSSAFAVDWSVSGSGTVNELRAVRGSSNGRAVIVGDKGTILHSDNGKNWTPDPYQDKTLSLSGVECNPSNGRFVAVCSNKNVALVSPDGINWGDAPKPTGSAWNFNRVRFLQNSFLAVGGVGTFRSSYNNGYSWSSLTTNLRNMQINGSAFGNGNFVAVGSAPLDNGSTGLGNTNLAIVSTDGINYTVGQTVKLVGGAKSINDVAFGNNLFVAVGADALIQTSPDGKNWTYCQVEFGQNLIGVTYGDGRFVAVGLHGLIMWSYDGLVWKKSTNKVLYSIKTVAYGNGMFVLVGPYGLIGTSPDGSTWSYRYSGTTNHLNGVAFGHNQWIAVGQNNTILTSSDGNKWTPLTPNVAIGKSDYTDIIYNTHFVITGTNGRIVRFIPNTFWSNPSSSTYKHLNTISYGNGRYIAGGNSGALQMSINPYYYPDTPGSPAEEALFRVGGTNMDENAVEEETPNVAFNATTYPNPVDDQFSVNIEGAEGEKVRLQLLDVSGRTILDKVVTAETGTHQETIPVTQKQTGMYVLRVSTATHTQSLKILKR